MTQKIYTNKKLPLTILLFTIAILLMICSRNKAFTVYNDFITYYTRYGQSDDITGPYADIVVKVGSIGEIVFSRGSSYLPFFEAKGEKYYFDENYQEVLAGGRIFRY